MFESTWLKNKQHNKTGLKYFYKTIKIDPCSYKGSEVCCGDHLRKHGRNVSAIWCKVFYNARGLTEYAILVGSRLHFKINNIIGVI